MNPFLPDTYWYRLENETKRKRRSGLWFLAALAVFLVVAAVHIWARL
jgi:hypothetical protein